MKIEFLPDGAPECPLVRIFDFDTSEACELVTTFDALANGDVSTSILGRPEQVQLYLQVSDEPTGLVPAKSGNSYFWTLSPEEWRDVARLVSPFCDRSSRGHQWLNDKGIPVLLSVNGTW